jgi:hypothetical protein
LNLPVSGGRKSAIGVLSANVRRAVPKITGNPPKESVVLKAKADTNIAQR